MSGQKISIGELIKAIRSESWDEELASTTVMHLGLNAQRARSASGSATYFSGIWFQAYDYMASFRRDKLLKPVNLQPWEQQLINSRSAYK